MAFAAYCKIDGITGESGDKDHKGWIEIRSFACGVSQRHNMGSGQGGLSGQGADFSTFTITHVLDKASTDLNKLCALGKAVNQVEVEICQSAEGQKPFMKYTLNKVIIASVHPSGDSGGSDPKPLEQIEFAYNEINWKYTPYKDDGSKEPEFKAGWDLGANKPTPGK